jgi:hypothetical protein
MTIGHVTGGCAKLTVGNELLTVGGTAATEGARITVTATSHADTGAAVDAATDRPAGWVGAFVVGTTAVVLTTAVFLVISVARNDGHLVYALDDAAIHMSMVKNLVDHGTWGVVPHEYVSASSSPGWELLLVGPASLMPRSLNVLPLLYNVASAIGIVWLLARDQRFLCPHGRNWLSSILLVELVVVAMLLPTMALVGMEHTTQALLTLLALVLFQRIATGTAGRHGDAALVGALFVAGMFRLEAVLVAAGVAAGLLLLAIPRVAVAGGAVPLRLRRAATLGLAGIAAAAIPFLIYGLVNKAFNLPFLPTSIESKSLREINEERIGIFRTPAGALDALRTDTLLLVVVLAIAVYLVLALRRGTGKNAPLALAFVVVVALHCFISDTGQMDRYQTYLLVAGVYVGLLILDDVVPTDARPAVMVVLIVAIPALGAVKFGLVWDTPTATSNTYLQRYQVGLFLEEYYDGEAVATGELGYVTYFHDGPVVDVLGIGDPEVLGEFEKFGPTLPPESLERIARERDVRAVAAYPATLVFSTPASWEFGGRWILDEKNVSAFDKSVDFLSIDETNLNELIRDLDEFDSKLPVGSRYVSRADIKDAFRERAESP